MPFEAPKSLTALLVNGVQCFATCWKLTRKDGTIYRFTDHDGALVVDGETYTPVDGVSASAHQKMEGLAAENLEVRGVLSDDTISHDDMRAGLWKGARIQEFVVDWRYPWGGKFHESYYHILDTEYDGERWVGQIEGLLARFKRQVGRTATKDCGWVFGDANCGVNTGALTQSGEVTALAVPRRAFQSDLTAFSDNWFDFGLLTWTSGLNQGLKSEIRGYLSTNGQFALQIVTPYNIQVGDTFDVYPGCNHTLTQCREKFDNVIRFGGFPYIPGSIKARQTPSANPGDD